MMLAPLQVYKLGSMKQERNLHRMKLSTHTIDYSSNLTFNWHRWEYTEKRKAIWRHIRSNSRNTLFIKSQSDHLASRPPRKTTHKIMGIWYDFADKQLSFLNISQRKWKCHRRLLHDLVVVVVEVFSCVLAITLLCLSRRCWVLTHTNTTMSSCVSFLWRILGNLSVVLHIVRVWVFCIDRICFVLAFHIFPALRAVFCFWPRYVVIWSGLATLIAPMGTICTTSVYNRPQIWWQICFYLFALFILFKISQKYCLESQSPGINGSVRSDLWLSDQVIESYIAAGQYVPWELRYTFSKDIVVKLLRHMLRLSDILDSTCMETKMRSQTFSFLS